MVILSPPEVRKETRQCDTEVRQLQQELSREREASARLRQQVAQNETVIQQLLSDTRQQIAQPRQEKEAQVHEKDVQIQRLQQQVSDIRREKEGQVHQLQRSLTQQQQQLSDVRRENDVRIQQLQQSLTETTHQLSHVRREKDQLQQRLGTTLSRTHSQEIEFWRVSPEEVQVDQEVLGGGAWGYVAKGTFRGQRVAVKRVYPSILQPTTVDRIRREISTMAQVRHPNLVLFIAAVLDDRTGPMIITELLDTSLRTAYEENRLGSNELRIFQNVASALNYLHLHQEPIIHRDVSTANVLLEAVANDVWKAKLSDFGSANLVRFATTPGEGAIIYTAPEAFPQHPRSRTPPPPQTPKIDVYSYGILIGEVVTQELPDPDNLQEMVQRVQRQWPQIHPLVTSSIQYSPDDRPTMAYILEELYKLTP